MCAQAGAGSGKKVTTSLLTSGLIVGAHASTRSPSWRSKYVQTLIHGVVQNVVYCVALQHVIPGRIEFNCNILYRVPAWFPTDATRLRLLRVFGHLFSWSTLSKHNSECLVYIAAFTWAPRMRAKRDAPARLLQNAQDRQTSSRNAQSSREGGNRGG